MLTNILLVIVVLLLAFIPRRMGLMTEDTKKFIIKALVAGAVIVALYLVVSPYQNCMRGYSRSDVETTELRTEELCREETNW